MLLRQFVASPTRGDQVAVALLLASERHGARLAGVLDRVAAAARADLRLRIEAQQRAASQARLVSGVIASVVAIVVLNRSYLAPFGATSARSCWRRCAACGSSRSGRSCASPPSSRDHPLGGGPVIPALVMGMVAGSGLWLMAQGWWPARRPLGGRLALGRTGGATRADRPPSPCGGAACVRGVAVEATGWPTAVPGRRPGPDRPDSEEQAVDKLQTALFGAGLPVVLAHLDDRDTAADRSGRAGVDRARARRMVPGRRTGRRRSIRGGARIPRRPGHLPRLVTILLAGGAGVEEALQDAAGYGTGWGFSLLRRAVNDARLSGAHRGPSCWPSPSAAGLDDLTELAGAMALAGESGAQVRRSLEASADALTARELSDVDARAASRTERMRRTRRLLVIGFVLLVIFPGVYSVVNL